MKLYYFETPNPRLACAVARHTGAPVEYVRVDLWQGEQRRPEYLAINPNAKVPTLVDDDRVLWEAPAIACYLAAKMGSDLWPQDDAKRIDITRWINWATAHFSRHAGSLYFERAVKPALGMGDPNPATIEESMRYFHQFATVLNDYLKGRLYLVGDRLTVADFTVASFLAVAEEAQLPLENYGEIRRWYRQIYALPAWKDPFPTSNASAEAQGVAA